MLQSVEGKRLTLRHKQVHGLPVAEAEHCLVLVDQLAENSEGVGVVRGIDGRLAIPGKVEFRRPL